MSDKSKPEREPVNPKEGLDRLDRLFRGVVSVSNKAVQEKMKAEKRKRQAKRKRLRSPGA